MFTESPSNFLLNLSSYVKFNVYLSFCMGTGTKVSYDFRSFSERNMTFGFWEMDKKAQTNSRRLKCHNTQEVSCRARSLKQRLKGYGSKPSLDAHVIHSKHIFHILIVTDADNDEVRCRWASGYGECGGICGGNGIPNAWIYFVSPKSILFGNQLGRIQGHGSGKGCSTA